MIDVRPADSSGICGTTIILVRPKKSPALRGFFTNAGQGSGDRRAIYPGLRVCRPALRRRSRLAQYVGRHFLAGATLRRYAEISLQRPQVRGASLSGFADLLVSDSVADADVHTIQYLTCLQAI